VVTEGRRILAREDEEGLERMSLLEELEQKARSVRAAIVYPEPQDERIVQAAALVAERGIARPVLVGEAKSMPSDVPAGVQTEIIADSPRLREFAASYAAQRRIKDAVALRMVGRPLVYAGMMVRCGYADGMVAGIAHTTATVLQSAGLTIGYQPGVDTASSCFIMIVPELRGERDVPLVFADCAVVIEPDVSQLASIAVASAGSARRFLGVTPRVAMLSFSTAGSAAHPAVDRVREAAKLAAEKLQDGCVEGEVQFDAAVNPDVAARKGLGSSKVAGRANVLIFPDLNCGNICYKAVRDLARALAIGPILQGFARPVNDLSRGASVEDVVGTTVVTCLQAAGAG